jgi:dienelactone hydrolase
MRSDKRGADAPPDADHRSVHVRPDLTAWAVLDTAELPTLADHNPRTVHWRDLPVDPALSGVAPGRARHAGVLLGGPPASRPWRLPLRTLASAGLAWHPARPLVAGLVQQGECLHPWSADYTTRHLTVHRQVRAALSLTSRRPGRPALSWRRDGRLILLTPPAPAAGDVKPVTGSDQAGGPVVFEATGPAHIAFTPVLSELLTLAGASVSVLDPATGALRTLTPPLLAGSLEPSPSGHGLLIEHATAADDGSPPASAGSGDGLGWSHAVLRTDGGSWTPVPDGTRWLTGTEEGTVSCRAVSGGTVFELRTGDAVEPSPIAGPEIAHADDDPPLWWRCLTKDGETTVVSRHRTSLRLRTGEDEFRVGLPDGLGRLGTPTADPGTQGFVLACERGDRAGFLRLVPGEPRTHITLEPQPGGTAGPLTSSWATVQDGVPQLLTRRSHRFDRYELRGHHLRPLRAALLPRLRPVPPRSRARTVSGTVVLSQPPHGRGARLTRLDDPARATDGAARMLWIQVRRDRGEPAYADPPIDPAAPRTPGWLLDLPLTWPSDAGHADIGQQITPAVDQALTRIREQTSPDEPVVVGGHSFAATVALYALAHCPELAGAVAHSGCYNRTLTPEGFHYERRSYWQAPDLYRAFSALDFADRLTRPVLLVHGLDDTNAATPADQAVALYRAVVANGGRARLVLLPHEGHTFRHRESLQTVTREHEMWLTACATPLARQPAGSERT